MGLHAAGLAGALEGLALTVQHRFGVACTLECEEPFPGLGHGVEAHMFRIAQEAVNNAVTHARTDRIEISLRGTDGEGRLGVRDNGVGLSDEALHGDGIGLHTMAYRARLIGGSLEVGRRTPAGPTVTCVFPLPETSDTGEDLDHARTDS